jgi:uncharacterized membrane protein
MWVGLKKTNAGIRFDLRAKVYLNGSPIASGQLDSVAGGLHGFKNANLNTIPLLLTAPVPVSSGDQLSIEILVRNACSGSGADSAKAVLWYDGQPIDTGPTRDAGSRFDATIGGSNSNYFLRRADTLNTIAGSSRRSVAKSAGGRCGPFHSFGIWNGSLP